MRRTHIFFAVGLVWVLAIGAAADPVVSDVTESQRKDGSESVTSILPGGVELEMVRIPAGTFLMGSNLDPGYSREDEAPIRTVTIGEDFFLGRYEITQNQWYAVMGRFPSTQEPSGLDYPVVNVSWNDAQAFVTQLNTLGIGTFRLPTEAEWEYACRAGSTTRWCFGDDVTLLADYAWCNTPSGPKPVGQKLPNAFGLYDMHGNVYEWVQDWYHEDYTGAPADGSAWEDPVGATRVLRGGAYYATVSGCRSACRYDRTPDDRNSSRGLRVVRILFEEENVHGDVNGDGKVDAVDIQLVINAVLDIITLPTADINRDGAVNAVDVQLVINAALNVN